MPFELRPYPTPTLETEGDYLQSGWRQSVYPMAERMGVHIALPRVSPQPYTRLAFEGAIAARDQDKAHAYNYRMFTAFFQDELDIGDADVLSDFAAEIGLDKKNFRAALEDGLHRQECEEQLRLGRDKLAINSMPTFVIDNRLGIPGLVPKDALVSVFRDQLAAAAE